MRTYTQTKTYKIRKESDPIEEQEQTNAEISQPSLFGKSDETEGSNASAIDVAKEHFKKRGDHPSSAQLNELSDTLLEMKYESDSEGNLIVEDKFIPIFLLGPAPDKLMGRFNTLAFDEIIKKKNYNQSFLKKYATELAETMKKLHFNFIEALENKKNSVLMRIALIKMMLQEEKELKKIDLSNDDLTNVDFDFANPKLKNITLKLTGATLTGFNLTGVNFPDVDFTGANLDGIIVDDKKETKLTVEQLNQAKYDFVRYVTHDEKNNTVKIYSVSKEEINRVAQETAPVSSASSAAMAAAGGDVKSLSIIDACRTAIKKRNTQPSPQAVSVASSSPIQSSKIPTTQSETSSSFYMYKEIEENSSTPDMCDDAEKYAHSIKSADSALSPKSEQSDTKSVTSNPPAAKQQEPEVETETQEKFENLNAVVRHAHLKYNQIEKVQGQHVEVCYYWNEENTTLNIIHPLTTTLPGDIPAVTENIKTLLATLHADQGGVKKEDIQSILHIIPEGGPGVFTNEAVHNYLRIVNQPINKAFKDCYKDSKHSTSFDPRHTTTRSVVGLGLQNALDDTNCARYVTALTIQAAGLASDGLPITEKNLKVSSAVERAHHFDGVDEMKKGLKDAYVKPLSENPTLKEVLEHHIQKIKCLLAEYETRKDNNRAYHGIGVPFSGYRSASFWTTKVAAGLGLAYSAQEKFDAATEALKILNTGIMKNNVAKLETLPKAAKQGELGKCIDAIIEKQKMHVTQTTKGRFGL